MARACVTDKIFTYSFPVYMCGRRFSRPLWPESVKHGPAAVKPACIFAAMVGENFKQGWDDRAGGRSGIGGVRVGEDLQD